MITIVDYGMGNLGSIVNMFKRIGVAARVTGEVPEIAEAKKLVLPGVGAFDTAMTRIAENGLRKILDRKALEEKVPILGICLGMQLLTNSSEEGNLPGLGWIPAHTVSFRKAIDMSRYKVPHMGWNLTQRSTPSEITEGFDEYGEMRFYFVHSFYVKCVNDGNSILRTSYGVEFDSAIQRENIFGVQFHPEKSHKFGMKILENFANLGDRC